MSVSRLPQVFVCLWKGCKVYNTPSTSQSWLQRHMLTHSGDKPFKVNIQGNTCSISILSKQSSCINQIEFWFPFMCLGASDAMCVFSAAVCGWWLQRQLRLPRRVSSPRPQPLQPAELLQNVRPVQTQGRVVLQSCAQQEEETQEQTQVLSK